jgi:hypothetical protein
MEDAMLELQLCRTNDLPHGQHSLQHQRWKIGVRRTWRQRSVGRLNSVAFHRFYKVVPGTIAIHSTASSLTAVHEFGHAISSYTNGKIMDLYVDSAAGFDNLLGRRIPPIFCDYNGRNFQVFQIPADEQQGTSRPKARQTVHLKLRKLRVTHLLEIETLETRKEIVSSVLSSRKPNPAAGPFR